MSTLHTGDYKVSHL